MTFASLGLIEPLLRALEALGYQTPTPVQAKAIPPVLEGRDLMAAAQTGTGKTAGFALPLLQRLTMEGPKVAANSVRSLVLVPTRELAEQVHEAIRQYAEHLPLTTYAVYGGVSINPQMMKLRRGVDVLVATPGPSARFVSPERREVLSGSDPDSRRSRPHARSRFLRRAARHLRRTAETPPDATVLRDLLRLHPRARRANARQPAQH
jgi:superfamily II DNA/RNA helicase